MPVSEVATSAGKGLLGNIGVILLFLLKQWRIVFTVIAIAILFWNAMYESAQTKSLEPMINQVGKKVFLADLYLYNYLKNPPDADGFWKNTKVIATIMSFAWVLLTIIYIVYFLISKSPFSDESNVGRNIVFSIVIVAFMQVVFCLSISTDVQNDKGSCFIPYKGSWELIKQSPQLLKPVQDKLSWAVDDKFNAVENDTMLNVTGGE